MYSQILAPLDESPLAERALPHAQAIAQEFGATLHLLEVVSTDVELEAISVSEINPSLVGSGRDVSSRIITERLELALEYLKRQSEPLERAGVTVELAVREGKAADEIADYAEQQKIDLIVMSAHGSTGIRRVLNIGSVTDRVMRIGKTPVLVIPPS